ncbi:MAG: CmcI family methyltransferase [Actinomycetes bacterium]
MARYATKAMRTLEEPVLRAFVRLAARQRARGGYTPALEGAVAEVVRGLSTRDKKGKSRASSPALAAITEQFGATFTDDENFLNEAGEQAIAPLVERIRMTRNGNPRTWSPAVNAITDQFHKLYYDDKGTWHRTRWLGTKALKCPFDMWMYQEIIVDIRPGLIVETGTAYGGSANYMARICDLIDHGEIVTVDLDPKPNLPQHPRVTYITGSSTDPVIVDKVRGMLPTDKPILVILDSDHSEQHVYNELKVYADMVTPGSYLIVEDTNVNGHPVHLKHGPGPMEALERFLAERDDFEVDRSMERYHLSQNPRGYLRRK